MLCKIEEQIILCMNKENSQIQWSNNLLEQMGKIDEHKNIVMPHKVVCN
jgi:hypothetical protein